MTNLINYDRINLVNDFDEIIGNVDKLKAHEGKAMLHQAISLFLFRKNKAGKFELLMQKRSAQKIVGANQWANTVCGNVAMGENHQQCLWRRLREELGINFANDIHQQVKKILVFNYFTPCNQKYSEREIDHIFTLVLNEQQVANLSINLNPIEVSEVRWVDWSELSQKKNIANFIFTPWFKLFLHEIKVTQAIERFLENITE